MAFGDGDSLMALAMGLMALTVFVLEPYATTRLLSDFLLVAGFMGIVLLFGIGMMIFGVLKFFTKGETAHFQFGLVCVIFGIAMSNLPLEILFSPLF